MNYFLLAAILVVSVCAIPDQLVTDEQGQQYHLVPQVRFKRQQKTDFQIKSPGIGTLSHTGTILDNDNHRLDGTGYVVKDFRRGGIAPDAYGGQLDYSNKPTHLDLGLGADHVRQGGTGVKATGTWNFIDTKDAKVGVSGYYGREFGGPGGAGRPDYGAFLGAKLRF